MPTPFDRTLRALEGEGRGSLIAGLVGAALVVLWLGWFIGSSVTLFEATDEARLETSNDVFSVEAQVSGRLVGCRVRLGAAVTVGDVVCELDAAAEQARLAEETRRHRALEHQIALTRTQIGSVETALEQDRDARSAAIAEAQADAREAAAESRRATDAATRLAALRDSGRLSALEFSRIEADAERSRAIAEARDLRAERLDLERNLALSERRAAIRSLERELDRLAAEVASSDASMRTLEQDIEKRRLRAPAAGKIGDLAPIRAGAVVSPGQRLAAVVPTGELRIVAVYAPAAALGRIRAGQNARFRLAGFPSSQYGTVNARVVDVALEPRDDRIRVELTVMSRSALPVPLRHGLPGRVEVQLERVSPLTVVLRAAGRLVNQQQATAGS